MKKTLIDNAVWIVFNTLSVLAFLFMPQFVCGCNNFSVMDLLTNHVTHRAFWTVLAVLGALMNVISVFLYIANKHNQSSIILLFLPMIEIILQFAVIFNLVSVQSENSIFFGSFTALTALTVFLAPLISLYKVKIIAEE
ncbi:MAG: hypothetical protein K2G60_05700 [Oscillospiraceae bacterium]|nr:hypothetical protein [Oscillospiraceae bacterium]